MTIIDKIMMDICEHFYGGPDVLIKDILEKHLSGATGQKSTDSIDKLIDKRRKERDTLSLEPSYTDWTAYENAKQFVLDLKYLKEEVTDSLQKCRVDGDKEATDTKEELFILKKKIEGDRHRNIFNGKCPCSRCIEK